MNLRFLIPICTMLPALAASAQNSDEDFNNLLAAKFGRQAMYSGALGNRDLKSQFAAGYDQADYHVTNVVYVGFGPRTQVFYPRVLLTETYEMIQQRNLFGEQKTVSPDAWHAWSGWHFDSGGHNTSDFRYEAKDALYGFWKITDKKYYLFWVPSYAGYEGAYNINAAQCDILYADVGSAVSSDIEFHKPPIIDAVRMNVSAAVWANSERLTKTYLNSKPAPAGMKDTALESRMLVLMRRLWEQGIKSRDVKLDMLDAKVTRIWIVSKGWKTVRGTDGKKKERILAAQALACTTRNCYLANVVFRQACNNNGRYADELSVNADEAKLMARQILQIPCNAVK